MNLAQQYLAQVVSHSANNLRLSSEKIEIVGLIRELLLSSTAIESDIKNMKKVTEFSRLAIKLSEILHFLSEDKVDFLTISEKFKAHGNDLTRDFGVFIASVNIREVKSAINKLDEFRLTNPVVPENPAQNAPETKQEEQSASTEGERNKERFIMEDDKVADEDMLFQNYEAAIMRPIKTLDALFKKIQKGDIHPDEYIHCAKMMKANSELSARFGTEIIANMHRIVAKGLILLKNREIMPGKEVIESLRSCLIVIVALVKSKEVDISAYLNRAEEFHTKIKAFKIKELA
ncbi:MAG: hypothetical protein HY965_08125 [Ignavibacteriales bacterium]|nr:hypothetical protein [Ignavibacteriales bacterium]